jgi:hypothetical protein
LSNWPAAASKNFLRQVGENFPRPLIGWKNSSRSAPKSVQDGVQEQFFLFPAIRSIHISFSGIIRRR